MIGPGLILPPGALLLPKLPPSTSIVITRESDKPTRIVVKQGKQTWEVTQSQLNFLPNELRLLVEPMLGRGSAGGMVFSLPPSKLASPPHARAAGAAMPPPVPAAPVAADHRLEKQLEAMTRELRQIHHSLDELLQDQKKK